MGTREPSHTINGLNDSVKTSTNIENNNFNDFKGNNVDRNVFDSVPNKDQTILQELSDRIDLIATQCNNCDAEPYNIKLNDKKLTSRSVNPLFLLLRKVNFVKVIVKKWILLYVLITCVSAYREQRFAIEPQDQSAVIGSRVTLPCRVENKAGQLQWTKDDFGLGTHRHLVGYERYKMIGSDEEGDYSLDIREVTLDDDAAYQCQVSSGPRGEKFKNFTIL